MRWGRVAQEVRNGRMGTPPETGWWNALDRVRVGGVRVRGEVILCVLRRQTSTPQSAPVGNTLIFTIYVVKASLPPPPPQPPQVVSTRTANARLPA